MEGSNSRSCQSMLWILAAVVIFWRIAAYVVPDEGPDGVLRLALAGLGLLFVACGLVAYRKSPNPAVLLFALYAMCAGMHWGGPIGSSSFSENPLWLGVYVVASSILGETFLLHFALEFPPAWRSLSRKWVVRLLYLPSLIAALLLPLAVFASGDSSSGEMAKTGVLMTYMVTSYFGYAVAAVFALRVARSERRAPSAIVLGGLVLGALPYLLHESLQLPGPSDVYNLFFALTPIAILVALGMNQKMRAG